MKDITISWVLLLVRNITMLGEYLGEEIVLSILFNR